MEKLDMSTVLTPFNTSMIDGWYNFSTDGNITNMTTTAAPPALVIDQNLPLQNLIYNHLGPFVCMFGMITNVLNLAVLTSNQLPESPYTHLTGLACTDFSVLMLSFIYLIFSRHSFAYEWRFYEAYIFIGFVNVCTTSSVWITVQLTVERFLFVRHPLWAKDTCDRASAKVKILMTIIVATIFNIPRFLCFEPTYHEAKGAWILNSTPFRTGDIYYACIWAHSICVSFIPLIILSAANIYLVFAVHQAGQQRQKLQIRNNREAAWQREQRRLTITLISIVFLFIVCIIPSAFSDRPIAYALFGGGKTETEFVVSKFYFSLQYVANFLVWLELSLNFVLYCAFNEKFRRVMKFTATRCVKKIPIPLCRNKGTALPTGQSSTRNSMLNTNSLMINSKGSLVHHECQPLQKQSYAADKKDDTTNGSAPLMKSRV